VASHEDLRHPRVFGIPGRLRLQGRMIKEYFHNFPIHSSDYFIDLALEIELK